MCFTINQVGELLKISYGNNSDLQTSKLFDELDILTQIIIAKHHIIIECAKIKLDKKINCIVKERFLNTTYNISYNDFKNQIVNRIKEIGIELTNNGYYVKIYDTSLNIFDTNYNDNKELNFVFYISIDNNIKHNYKVSGSLIYEK